MMEKLNGISVVIQADMWGVSQSLQRIQVTIKVEDSQAILQSVYLNGSNAYACEDITEDFSSNIRVKDLYFKLDVIDSGNGGNINFIDENNDAILSFDFCQYEWSILDIFQDIDVVDKLIERSTKQDIFSGETISDNKIPQETKELIEEVFNKAFEKDVWC